MIIGLITYSIINALIYLLVQIIYEKHKKPKK